LGDVRKMAKAGCVGVAFLADTIVKGKCGIHIRNCLPARAAIFHSDVFFFF